MKLGIGLGFGRNNFTGGAFSFTSSLPADFTYARNDSVATYRDSSGDLRASSANAPRFDYSGTGKALGLKIEPSRQNKCENTNVNPTDIAGISISGTGASLTVVDDSAALAASGLGKLCTNGNVFKAMGGSSTASIDIDGATGAVTAHSYSVWARGEGSGSVGALKRTGSGSPNITISDSATYSRFLLEDETDGTSNKLRITANAGETVYFILNQLEEGADATSEIVVSGAAATRQVDSLTIASPNAHPYFDEEQGFMAVSFRLSNKVTANSVYLAVAHDGSSSETIGLRVGTGNDVRGFVKAGGLNKHTSGNDDEVPVDVDRSLLHCAAICWKSGEAFIASSGAKNLQSYAGDPGGITTINFGSRNSNNDPMTGHIASITIGGTYPSDLEIGKYLAQDFDRVIHSSGQSNMSGYFRSTATGSGAGRKAMLDEFADAQPALDVLIVEGATGGAALLEAAAGSTYFVDQDTGLFDGSAWGDLETAMELTGNRGDLFIWDQGEADAADLDDATEPTGATYKTNLKALFDKIRTVIGAVECLIIPIGWRTVFTNAGGWQLVRTAQREVASENAYVEQGPEKVDQALTDGVHLTDAGYVTHGTRIGRKCLDVLGVATPGVDGPALASATRSGTIVTATITHDAGTDFTVGSTGTGFHFFGRGNEIVINSVSRTSATTLELVLASVPTGVEELFYLYDADTALNTANVLVDNAATPMVLKSGLVVL